MDFDRSIDRHGTHSQKWDMMEKIYGVPASDGIPMWVADMDFQPPQCVSDALQDMIDHGIYGYYGDDRSYLSAIRWWMQERHGWRVEPDWIFTTHGLVNGTAMCVDTFTAPGDAVVLFTPVYHAFSRVINAAGREVRECPLVENDGRYEMDFAAYDRLMTGSERMVILCSPHNPGGRVWSRAELEGVAEFARRHDLLLVSDEIHHDLVMPGHTHIPMPHVEGIADRLVMMTAASKTFGIAGAAIGNVIIAGRTLRARFAGRLQALAVSVASIGKQMVPAAYSPGRAAWVNTLVRYLDGNRRVFEEGVAAIPGLRPMPLEGTYLSWVD